MSTSRIETTLARSSEVGVAVDAARPLGQVVAREGAEGLRSVTGRRVTVVVPTYCEAENLTTLIERLRQVRLNSGLDLDLVLVDDDSQDGSEKLVGSLAFDWVRMVVRRADRGLSQSVIAGLEQSTSPFLVVMSADLSHPPEKIPALIAALEGHVDFAIGSRFVEGAATHNTWGSFRWFYNRVATLMARPLTQLKDPMSGFFALRRETYLRGRERLDPVGYKIGLELLMKCGCRNVVEVPIDFVERRRGASKVSLRDKLRYIRHVRRLYNDRFGAWSHFVQFAFVGFSGVFVNILLLTVFMRWGMARQLSVALAIALSMVWNFALNRRFSFSFARRESVLRQFFGFVGACSLGAVVNYFITNLMCHWISSVQLAAAVGVVGGTGFNFLVSRFLVFRTKRVHQPETGRTRGR